MDRIREYCRFFVYLERWHREHPGEERDCILYVDALEKGLDSVADCDRMACPYRPVEPGEATR